MNTALVTVDPISEKGRSFARFCELIRIFQNKGFFRKTSIASVIHGSLYTVPLSWYQDMRERYASEALQNIQEACGGRFKFETAMVLLSETSANEGLVYQLCRYGQRKKAEILVVSSNERKGLPHWILGSFSETAILTATLPVLVIKPHLHLTDLSREIRFLLAVDIAAPPSSKDVHWIARMAKTVKAHIDVIYIEPIRRVIVDAFPQRANKNGANRVLRTVRAAFDSVGIKSNIDILKESKSVAHTLVEFAEQRKIWLIITTAPERSKTRKLLLGSTARRILRLTKHPFLSLRLDQNA